MVWLVVISIYVVSQFIPTMAKTKCGIIITSGQLSQDLMLSQLFNCGKI